MSRAAPACRQQPFRYRQTVPGNRPIPAIRSAACAEIPPQLRTVNREHRRRPHTAAAPPATDNCQQQTAPPPAASRSPQSGHPPAGKTAAVPDSASADRGPPVLSPPPRDPSETTRRHAPVLPTKQQRPPKSGAAARHGDRCYPTAHIKPNQSTGIRVIAGFIRFRRTFVAAALRTGARPERPERLRIRRSRSFCPKRRTCGSRWRRRAPG